MREIKWEKDLAECGCLHSEDCCANSAYGCDVGTGDVDCCENMKQIAMFFSIQSKKLIEHLSHDMNFENEKQRKAAIKMYIKSFKINL